MWTIEASYLAVRDSRFCGEQNYPSNDTMATSGGLLACRPFFFEEPPVTVQWTTSVSGLGHPWRRRPLEDNTARDLRSESSNQILYIIHTWRAVPLQRHSRRPLVDWMEWPALNASYRCHQVWIEVIWRNEARKRAELLYVSFGLLGHWIAIANCQGINLIMVRVQPVGRLKDCTLTHSHKIEWGKEAIYTLHLNWFRCRNAIKFTSTMSLLMITARTWGNSMKLTL